MVLIPNFWMIVYVPKHSEHREHFKGSQTRFPKYRLFQTEGSIIMIKNPRMHFNILSGKKMNGDYLYNTFNKAKFW